MSKLSNFEICKIINKTYNCPPVPVEYTGQLYLGCYVWGVYGKRIYNKGDTWFLDDIYTVGLVGFKFHSYWPAYCYNMVAGLLFKEGLVDV